MHTSNTQSSFQSRRQGFALVIALTLTAFIALLLLSVGALTQVEIQAERTTELRQTAKANAQLALLIALGELQKQAGPDKRATATGETIGEAAPQNRWTGVWNTGEATQQPAWLVSNAGNPTTAGEVEFLPFLDSTQRVRAPKVSIEEATTKGHYAWWIADEGVKAKINVIDPYRDLAAADSQQQARATANSAEGSECDKRSRYRLLSAQETGIALLLGADNTDNSISPCDPIIRNSLSQLYFTDQISLLQQGQHSAGSSSELSHKALFHDATVYGHGVLADMREGGLKTDLTLAFSNNEDAPAGFVPQWWNRLKDFYNRAGQSELTATVDTEGNHQHLFPVLVKMNYMIAMFLGETAIPANYPGGLETFPSGQTGKSVYIGLSVEFSLHNPYNTPMKLPHGFRIEVLLPAENNSTATGPRKRIQVASAFNADGSRRSEAELEAALGAGGLDRFYVSFDYDSELILEPGQTRLFSVNNNAGAGAAYKHVNTSASADAAVVATLNPFVRSAGSPDYVYKRAQIADTNGDNGLYIDLGKGINQSNEVILRLDTDASLQLQTRLGLLDSAGNVQAWFSGIRTALDITSAAPQINSVKDWSGTFSSTVSAPSGGFSISYEMPMARRKGISGKSLRPLVDYNMRAVPPALNDPATNGLVSYITPYYRVPTVVTNSFTGAKTAVKWTHFDLFHAGADNPRQRAMTDPESILMPGKANSSRATYGWAGPSPYGTEGSAKAKLRDTDIGSIYFDIPSEKPFSLGALRHAQILDSLHAPAYSVGNAYAPAFSTDSLSVEDDLHRLNQMLWDGYFFSSLTPAIAGNLTTSQTLPNSRIVPRSDQPAIDTGNAQPTLPTNSGTAAGQLLVNGAFNVNSTSVAAWRAVLASMRNTLADYRSDTALAGTPYSRLSRSVLNNSTKPYTAGSNNNEFSTSAENDIGTGNRQYIYHGIRLLTDTEIDTLARNIVMEIIERGTATKRPFLSMAEFVNRPMKPVGNEPVTQLKGLLQLAIDGGPWESDSADSVLKRWDTPADAAHAQEQGTSINADIFKNDQVPKQGLNGLVQAADNNQYPVNANGINYLHLEPRSSGAPAAISQSDILAALAPILNARSDIFVIRAYGDAVAADGTSLLARAWCEAVVQRMPDPVIRKNSTPDTSEYYEPTVDSEESLGRKFVVLSFRWLSEEGS